MAEQTGIAKARRNSQDVARPFESIVSEMRSRAELDSSSGDGFEVASRVIDAMAQATSWDEIVAAQSNVGDLEDLLNVPLNVTDLRFIKSGEQYKGGVGVYVYVEGHNDNGEPFSFTTGAVNVTTAFYLAQSRLGLGTVEKPLRCRVQSRATANGTLYTVAKA